MVRHPSASRPHLSAERRSARLGDCSRCLACIAPCQGILLQITAVLHADLRPVMGELAPDTVVTMHVIVRLAPAGKPQSELPPMQCLCQSRKEHRLQLLQALPQLCNPWQLCCPLCPVYMQNCAGCAPRRIKTLYKYVHSCWLDGSVVAA